MGRVARAMIQLLTPDAPAARGRSIIPHSLPRVVSPRSGDVVSPYQNFNRDQPLRPTSAAPGARQTWELHRVREESRDLALRSPIWGNYVIYSRIQTIGYELSRLQFDRLTREQKSRLEAFTKFIRNEWNRFQNIKNVGGTGRTVHQMAGSALHHVNVDGDCFLLPRRVNGRRVWDLHPGDALAETSTKIQNDDGDIRLGVQTDPYGRPVSYYFGSGAKLAALNWAYYNYGGAQNSDVKKISADRLSHIRDMSGEITAVRGWPRCSGVVDDIARLDDWYGALVRSAVARAAVGIALERDPALGAADIFGQMDNMSALAALQASQQSTTGGDVRTGGEPVRPYQEWRERAGDILEFDPGYKARKIDTGAPTAQEATAIGMLERRVAAALRTSPATLFGDYKGLSFSAGQLANLQDRQAVEDNQMMLVNQYYNPIFKDWFLGRWIEWVGMFPEVEAADLDGLLYPTIILRKYQILDKGRLVAQILNAFEKGAITYAEMRAEIGFTGANVDEVIEQWKEDRRALGLPDSLQSAAPGAAEDPDDDDDEEDPDDDEEDDDEEDEENAD